MKQGSILRIKWGGVGSSRKREIGTNIDEVKWLKVQGIENTSESAVKMVDKRVFRV